jgi:tripartite motif-containing protein 71
MSSFSTRDAENVLERFGHPSDMVLSRLGDLYICDTENGRIVKVNSASRVETSFGGFGAGQGRLQHPVQVEIGANDWVYVLDPPRVIVFDGFGNFLSTLPEGVLSHPTGLFADTKGIMVVDGDSLFCFDAAHHLTQFFSLAALMGRECANVTSLVVAGGSLYVLCADGLSVMPDPRE